MFLSNFRLKTTVQKFLCTLQEIGDFSRMHPVREMQKAALGETVAYISQHMRGAVGVYTPRQLLDHALPRTPAEGHVLEFGVFKGGTIRHIASRLPKRAIHGFDSFEGLPSDWSGYTMGKGYFSMKGKLPSVPRQVKLHPGWFDASLPKWLNDNPGSVAFLHIDCDLYESTKTILDLLTPRLVPGSIILFDEYFGYPNWQAHEFRAFQEYVAANGVTYEYVGYSRIQVALRIVGVPVPGEAKSARGQTLQSVPA